MGIHMLQLVQEGQIISKGYITRGVDFASNNLAWRPFAVRRRLTGDVSHFGSKVRSGIIYFVKVEEIRRR